MGMVNDRPSRPFDPPGVAKAFIPMAYSLARVAREAQVGLAR
jgi:hypothetical protein